MSYTAQQLITRSWFLSGIIARNLQTPTGDQITDGLAMLNDLLNFKQIETDLTPYWTYIQMPLVGGQEFYYMPNVAAIESMTFNIGVVRYPMVSASRRTYFGTSRVDNIQTLPFDYNFNRGEGGGTLALYFLPQSAFPAKMMVKFFLNDVTLGTDLTNAFTPLGLGFVSNITMTNQGSGYTSTPTVTITGIGTGATAVANVLAGKVISINIVNAGTGYNTAPTITITGGGGTGAAATAVITNFTFLQTTNAGYDTSYIEYLRYALAQYMCSEYGILFNPESEKILKKYERKLMYIGPPDLKRNGTSILTEVGGLNWADINIGMGWRPS